MIALLVRDGAPVATDTDDPAADRRPAAGRHPGEGPLGHRAPAAGGGQGRGAGQVVRRGRRRRRRRRGDRLTDRFGPASRFGTLERDERTAPARAPEADRLEPAAVAAEHRPKGKPQVVLLAVVAAFVLMLDLVTKTIVVANIDRRTSPVRLLGGPASTSR